MNDAPCRSSLDPSMVPMALTKGFGGCPLGWRLFQQLVARLYAMRLVSHLRKLSEGDAFLVQSDVNVTQISPTLSTADPNRKHTQPRASQDRLNTIFCLESTVFDLATTSLAALCLVCFPLERRDPMFDVGCAHKRSREERR